MRFQMSHPNLNVTSFSKYFCLFQSLYRSSSQRSNRLTNWNEADKVPVTDLSVIYWWPKISAHGLNRFVACSSWLLRKEDDVRVNPDFEQTSRFVNDLKRCIDCGNCTLWCPVYEEEQLESSVARGKQKMIR